MSVVQGLHQFCFSTERNTCASVIGKRHLATFRHGVHLHWLVLGTDLIVWPVDNVILQYSVKVVDVNALSDVVLLECDIDLCPDDICLRNPILGEEYYQLSLSANVDHFPKFFVNKGIVGSLQLSPALHILGSPGTCPGDSGGGCFTMRTSPAAPANIIAIVVGNKPQEMNIHSPLAHLTYPSRAVLVPAFVILPALQVMKRILSRSA